MQTHGSKTKCGRCGMMFGCKNITIGSVDNVQLVWLCPSCLTMLRNWYVQVFMRGKEIH